MSCSSISWKVSLVATFLALLSLPTISADAQTVVATIPAGTPTDVAVNTRTGLAYVPSGRHVDVVSERTNKIVGSIAIDSPRNLQEAAVDPLTNMLYVGDSNSLYVIDTRTK